jgi:hypothetical protein
VPVTGSVQMSSHDIGVVDRLVSILKPLASSSSSSLSSASSTSTGGVIWKWSCGSRGKVEWIEHDLLVIQDVSVDSGSTISLYTIPSWSSTSSSIVGTSSMLHQIKSSYDQHHSDGWQFHFSIPSRYNHDQYISMIEWITVTLMNDSCGGWTLLDLIAIVISYLI